MATRELTDIIDSGEIDGNLSAVEDRNKRVKSDTSVGGVGSEITNIIVLTQGEYDGLATKDPATLYCIKEE